MKRLLAVAAALGSVGVLLLPASPATAHPLGNFTVNHYARVELSDEVIRVHYVIDQAEVPTLADADAIARNPEAYVRTRVRAVEEGLQLVADGVPVPLRAVAYRLDQPAGEGRLPTTRIEANLEAALNPGGAREVRVRNGTDAGRLGWRELVVTARADARLVSSTEDAGEQSDELRAYPPDRSERMLDEREATFTFIPGSRAVALPALAASWAPPAGAANSSGDRLAGLLTRPLDAPLAVAAVLGLAVLFGCAHALAPGHGKSVMAAYLVGTRGRPRDAVALGVVVALMHTASALLLGFLLLRLGAALAPERMIGWLSLASGLSVLGVGLYLCYRRFARHRHDHGHHHDEHGHHDHGHHHDEHGYHGHGHDSHGHGHDGQHSHDLPDGVSPLSWPGLVALASAGGLVPSPSALIVLLSTATLGRLPLGLAMVGAFSIGLAATLTAVGLSLVWGRKLVHRRPRAIRLLALLPRVSAVFVTALGFALTMSAATQLG